MRTRKEAVGAGATIDMQGKLHPAPTIGIGHPVPTQAEVDALQSALPPPEAYAAAFPEPLFEVNQPAQRAIDPVKVPPLFTSANKGPGGISPDMERIVEAVYTVDAAKDYAELEANLEVGDQRTDYQTLMRHLDCAERRARRAHQLYLGMRLERKRWELDAQQITGSLRKRAIEDLEKEKLVGDRTKRITNDDVDGRMSELFGDEVRAQEIKRVKLEGAEKQLEFDAALWKGKCHSLSTMLSNLRK